MNENVQNKFGIRIGEVRGSSEPSVYRRGIFARVRRTELFRNHDSGRKGRLSEVFSVRRNTSADRRSIFGAHCFRAPNQLRTAADKVRLSPSSTCSSPGCPRSRERAAGLCRTPQSARVLPVEPQVHVAGEMSARECERRQVLLQFGICFSGSVSHSTYGSLPLMGRVCSSPGPDCVCICPHVCGLRATPLRNFPSFR